MGADFRPGFGFARRRGVTVAGRDDQGRFRIITREPIDLEALREVRRNLSGATTIEKLSEVDYSELISRLYQAADAVAHRATENLNDELDLTRLAEQLPEPADLLEADDRAKLTALRRERLQGVGEPFDALGVEPGREHATPDRDDDSH